MAGSSDPSIESYSFRDGLRRLIPFAHHEAGVVSTSAGHIAKDQQGGSIRAGFFDEPWRFRRVAVLPAQVVTTAIKTAVQSYIPLARDASKQIFLAMPYGKYHKEFDKDRKEKIEKKVAESGKKN